MAAAFRGHQEAAKLVLDAGADINARHNTGQTPLIMAASKSHVDMVKLLIDRGANITIRDQDGKTALTEAAEQGSTEIVKHLLAKERFGKKLGNQPLLDGFHRRFGGGLPPIVLQLETSLF